MSDLDDLSAFATLMDMGCFDLAAQRLGLSRDLLARRIRQLERRHGVQLLQRGRRVALTPAGVALLPQARSLVLQAEHARLTLARLKDDMAGPVRITVPVALGETLCEALLSEFAHLHPDVQVELSLCDAWQDLLVAGFDLAIRTDVDHDQNLVARPLLAIQGVTCASPAYLAKAGVPATVRDLADHQCLTQSHFDGPEEWIYQGEGEPLRIRVSGRFASNQQGLLLRAALAGVGIARLPSYLVQDEVNSGRLVWLLRNFRTQRLPMFLLHPYQGPMPRRIQALVDYLVHWFQHRCQMLDEQK